MANKQEAKMTELLENVLIYIYKHEGVEAPELIESTFKSAEQKYIAKLNTIIQELLQEQYIYSYNEDVKIQLLHLSGDVGYEHHTYYCISSKGEEFLKAPYLIYRGKPFEYARFKRRLNTLWRIVKIIAAASVSVGTLYLSSHGHKG